jgi:S1-C subfamily serine protease
MVEAGIQNGDVILEIDGAPIRTVQDVFDRLEGKRPGDMVTLKTEQGIKSLELVSGVDDPHRPALGVKLIPNLCQ